MSNKKLDKGKLYHKLHQLQKRVTRMNNNDGHSDEKFTMRMSRIRTLIEGVRGKGKLPKQDNYQGYSLG